MHAIGSKKHGKMHIFARHQFESKGIGKEIMRNQKEFARESKGSSQENNNLELKLEIQASLYIIFFNHEKESRHYCRGCW